MFCPDCGKEISNNAEFCGSCGFKVTNTETVVEQESVVESDVEAIPRRRGVGEGPNNGLILTILEVFKIIVGFLLIVSVFAFLGDLTNPDVSSLGNGGALFFIIMFGIFIILRSYSAKYAEKREREYYRNKN